MWDLQSAIKKLSLNELRQRWEEYQALPLHSQQALQTYLVAAVLIVGALTMCVASYLH